jgi:hypothetical protein
MVMAWSQNEKVGIIFCELWWTCEKKKMGLERLKKVKMVKMRILPVKVPDVMAPAMSSDLVGPDLVIATWASIFLSSFL